MTVNQKIIVFDFDGVVCDSTDECMVSSWNAWEKWESRSSFRNSVTEFTDEEKDKFRKVRPRVRGAGEYYILRRAFSESINIEDQSIYDRLEKEWQKYISSFKVVFLESRECLRQENLEEWIDLHHIYDPVITVMKRLNKQNRLYMATLKDAESVRLILGKQGLEITADKLLDQAKIKSKLQALDKFSEKTGNNKNEIIFIDDNVTHLIEPKLAGYKVWMSTWGTVLSDYLDIAERERIQLLSINKLDEITK